MSREWKPGDVAAIPFSRGWVRCIYTPEGWVPSDNNSDPAVKGYRDVHPLVVIDPEDREQVERLLSNYHSWKWEHATRQPSITDMQAALREFASPTPPRPDEPMGLGAVVEDERGRKWIAHEPDGGMGANAFRWLEAGSAVGKMRRRWSDIAAVRVLSEGVSDD